MGVCLKSWVQERWHFQKLLSVSIFIFIFFVFLSDCQVRVFLRCDGQAQVWDADIFLPEQSIRELKWWSQRRADWFK